MADEVARPVDRVIVGERHCIRQLRDEAPIVSNCRMQEAGVQIETPLGTTEFTLMRNEQEIPRSVADPSHASTPAREFDDYGVRGSLVNMRHFPNLQGLVLGVGDKAGIRAWYSHTQPGDRDEYGLSLDKEFQLAFGFPQLFPEWGVGLMLSTGLAESALVGYSGPTRNEWDISRQGMLMIVLNDPRGKADRLAEMKGRKGILDLEVQEMKRLEEERRAWEAVSALIALEEAEPDRPKKETDVLVYEYPGAWQAIQEHFLKGMIEDELGTAADPQRQKLLQALFVAMFGQEEPRSIGQVLVQKDGQADLLQELLLKIDKKELRTKLEGLIPERVTLLNSSRFKKDEKRLDQILDELVAEIKRQEDQINRIKVRYEFLDMAVLLAQIHRAAEVADHAADLGGLRDKEPLVTGGVIPLHQALFIKDTQHIAENLPETEWKILGMTLTPRRLFVLALGAAGGIQLARGYRGEDRLTLKSQGLTMINAAAGAVPAAFLGKNAEHDYFGRLLGVQVPVTLVQTGVGLNEGRRGNSTDAHLYIGTAGAGLVMGLAMAVGGTSW